VNIYLAPQKLSPFTYSATIALNIWSRASKPTSNFLWVKVWVKVVNSIDKLLNNKGYL
jgi:hypothetical protein